MPPMQPSASLPQSTEETTSRTPTFVETPEAAAEDVNVDFEHEAYGPAPGEKPVDQFEVLMHPDDVDNPKAWPRPSAGSSPCSPPSSSSMRTSLSRLCASRRSSMSVSYSTFSSSAPSGIIPQMKEEFGFGNEVAVLTISLFVAGYCQVGRRPVFIGSFVVYTIFQIACAVAPNTAAILIFRFLGGTFAAAPLANSGAVISDIWDADTRGKALALFTLAPFAGPSLGPTVSGFMAVAGVKWEWVYWLQAIFAGVCTIAIVFFLPETYAPIILVKRAQKLRKDTGNDRYWAPLERNNLEILPHIRHVLSRPFVVLANEPMLVAITLYMSFVYGVIYLLFEAYPIVFTVGHGFNAGLTGLTFLPIFVGGAIGVGAYLLFFNPRYQRAIAEFAPHPVPPEYRLEICMWAAPIYTLSFFWFGWTSFPSVSYWAPLLSGLPMGVAVIFLFLGLFNYVIDAYLFVAASALSAMTVVRSLFGAGFPLFATQMYETLNPRWASTLLGLLALVMTPIPFVLRRYGHHLRRRSKYAPTGDGPRKPSRPASVEGEKASA
ncbi:MFS general substrate transporter [Epithele typhae]|uniref:MFS general substrate transporter n=1 Tax=Epithele typhae TaxID=378194 RepID=UPI0020087E62|nr:MFS general substrate transporter [Epithele typhae]KAH9926316.1 MFS general substrate transporter [Epithele typhae]